MLTILIGLIIFIVLTVIAVKIKLKKVYVGSFTLELACMKIFKKQQQLFFILLTVACVILIFSIMLGLFIPLQGYKKTYNLISKAELVNISDTLYDEKYVIKDNQNAYFYNFKTTNGVKKDYVVGKVIVIESKDCKEPVLLEYQREPKRGLWTFALFVDDIEYVFYVPNGTVILK